MENQEAVKNILQLSQKTGIELAGAKIRRTSSRFCLGVEHGDYNGTELFGVGTNRFIWLAYKPNGTSRIKLYSGNFPNDGIIEFEIGKIPKPKSKEAANSWARFPYGVNYVIEQQGYKLKNGIDGIIYGNIPGGGMSRSASLTLNLILTLLEVNDIKIEDPFKIIDMAQAVENQYIGSPCGQLDQIMIFFAKAGMGTHYNPKTRTVNYVPFGQATDNFKIAVLDTGTVRPGLEKSTYKIRRAECEQLVELAQKASFKISCLANIKTPSLYESILNKFQGSYPNLCKRMKYIYYAQQRFYEMLAAWKKGDIAAVGKIFREDGIGLRDDYEISGPELETMCDIARTVPGVCGERMLGGGDKGAAGALICTGSVDMLKRAVDTAYPRVYPQYRDKYAVHVCKMVQGVKVYAGLLG